MRSVVPSPAPQTFVLRRPRLWWRALVEILFTTLVPILVSDTSRHIFLFHLVYILMSSTRRLHDDSRVRPRYRSTRLTVHPIQQNSFKLLFFFLHVDNNSFILFILSMWVLVAIMHFYEFSFRHWLSPCDILDARSSGQGTVQVLVDHL